MNHLRQGRNKCRPERVRCRRSSIRRSNSLSIRMAPRNPILRQLRRMPVLRHNLLVQTKVAKGDYPYGIPVPNKPHLVESPYSPGKYVDVEGFAPGTEVKDPYTQKIFLVP